MVTGVLLFILHIVFCLDCPNPPVTTLLEPYEKDKKCVYIFEEPMVRYLVTVQL